MGRSGTLLLASALLLVPGQQAGAQALGTPAYWDGFYLGILGGAGTDAATGTDRFGSLGLVAGAGGLVNGAFYFGAEAQLAAESFNGSDPYLWLEADGRLGAQVTEAMLLFTSAGLAYDADARQLALTGAAGAEFMLADGIALRAQYSLQHYPGGLGTFHAGQAGVIFRFD